MTALLDLHGYALTDPYDIAAYPHSGFPDTASYLLSDALGGNVVGGLLIYPALMLCLAALCARLGPVLRRRPA
jgi:hypothetical protein